ncbi:hypothetical protein [Serratia inhibens]|uniref:hypothetical protein n=1 Tax=Serratia inhibens TaxID=2338073 RepID=UPI003C7E5FC8
MKKLWLIMGAGACCGIDGSHCGGWRGSERRNERQNAHDEINHLQDERINAYTRYRH